MFEEVAKQEEADNYVGRQFAQYPTRQMEITKKYETTTKKNEITTKKNEITTRKPETTTKKAETTTMPAAEATNQKPLSFMKKYGFGDVNRDDRITPEDARLTLRASVGLEHFPENSAALLAADIDSNGKADAEDARLILRESVGLLLPEEWFISKLAKEYRMTLIPDKSEVKPGDTLAVTVNLKNCKNVKSFGMIVRAEGALAAVNSKKNMSAEEINMEINTSADEGALIGGYFSLNYSFDDYDLCTIAYKVSDSAEAGDTLSLVLVPYTLSVGTGNGVGTDYSAFLPTDSIKITVVN